VDWFSVDAIDRTYWVVLLWDKNGAGEVDVAVAHFLYWACFKM
jgi:hypothetical protein